MANKKINIIHLIDRFSVGIGKAMCGVYTAHLTSYSKRVTCKRCKKSRKR